MLILICSVVLSFHCLDREGESGGGGGAFFRARLKHGFLFTGFLPFPTNLLVKEKRNLDNTEEKNRKRHEKENLLDVAFSSLFTSLYNKKCCS